MNKIAMIILSALMLLGISVVPAQAAVGPNDVVTIRNVAGSNHSIVVYTEKNCQGRAKSVWAGRQALGRSYQTYWTSRAATYHGFWRQHTYSRCVTYNGPHTLYVHVYQGRI
jgi:hypothetical protein